MDAIVTNVLFLVLCQYGQNCGFNGKSEFLKSYIISQGKDRLCGEKMFLGVSCKNRIG